MKRYLLAFFGGYNEADKDEEINKDEEFLHLVHKAHKEWLAAQNYFENVSEPDLVDYAIYELETTRRKYMYLLKQARTNGLEDRQVFHQFNGANLS